MSTWTSSRTRLAAAFAAAALMLAACEDGSTARLGDTSGFADLSPKHAALEIGGRTVMMEPPLGFCIDPGTVASGPAGGFVLIGDCGLIESELTLTSFNPLTREDAGFRMRTAPIRAILTASVGAEPLLPGLDRSRRIETLEEALQSGIGGAMLGRGGDGSDTRVLQSRRRGDTLYLLLEDSSAVATGGMAPRFWRAFTEVNDRMTVLTISAFEGVHAGDVVMLRHLVAFRETLRAANA